MLTAMFFVAAAAFCSMVAASRAYATTWCHNFELYVDGQSAGNYSNPYTANAALEQACDAATCISGCTSNFDLTPQGSYPQSTTYGTCTNGSGGQIPADLSLGPTAYPCTETGYFVKTPVVPPAFADLGRSCPACNNWPDPTNPSSGNEFLAETDINPIGSRKTLGFERYYNSLDYNIGDLGPAWRHSFGRHLVLEYPQPAYLLGTGVSSVYSTQSDACTSGWNDIKASVAGLENATASFSNGVCTVSLNGTAVTTLGVWSNDSQDSGESSYLAIHAYRDDGHVINFTPNGSGFTAESGVGYQLVSTSNGFQLTDEQDNVETYNATGTLLSIADRAGNTETLSYNSSTGQLESVTDSFGHGLTFAYDREGQLTSVTDSAGNLVKYDYNSAGQLTEVTNLDETTRQYVYDDPNWSNGISSVLDENGSTEFMLSYNTEGQVTSSTLAGVSSSMTFAYNSDGSTTETDPLGAVRTFTFQQIGDHELSSSVSGAPCLACG